MFYLCKLLSVYLKLMEIHWYIQFNILVAHNTFHLNVGEGLYPQVCWDNCQNGKTSELL